MIPKHVALIWFYGSPLPYRHILMLRSLKKLGCRVSVIAWDRTGLAKIPKGTDQTFDDWHYIRIPAPTSSAKIALVMPLYFYKLRKLFTRLDKPDLVILTHIVQLPIAWFLRGPKVYDAMELFSVELSLYFNSFGGVLQSIIRLFEGILISRLNGVLTVDSRQGWLEKFYRKWNVHTAVIWNVPSQDQEPSLEEIRSSEPMYNGLQVIAFAGALMREKGLRVAIEVASLVKEEFPDVVFLLVGPMKDNGEEVRQLIVDKGVEGNVRLLDFMEYRQLIAHLRHAQIGLALHQKDRVYPYVAAGNGRKFFTYMQSGLAIVGPSFGEVGKAVQLARCGLLVDTERPDEIANAIVHLLSNPTELERMKKNSRKAFLKHFNWEIEEKKFLSFLNSVMDRKRLCYES